jgi:hypothetical protein
VMVPPCTTLMSPRLVWQSIGSVESSYRCYICVRVKDQQSIGSVESSHRVMFVYE